MQGKYYIFLLVFAHWKTEKVPFLSCTWRKVTYTYIFLAYERGIISFSHMEQQNCIYDLFYVLRKKNIIFISCIWKKKLSQKNGLHDYFLAQGKKIMLLLSTHEGSKMFYDVSLAHRDRTIIWFTHCAGKTLHISFLYMENIFLKTRD